MTACPTCDAPTYTVVHDTDEHYCQECEQRAKRTINRLFGGVMSPEKVARHLRFSGVNVLEVNGTTLVLESNLEVHVDSSGSEPHFHLFIEATPRKLGTYQSYDALVAGVKQFSTVRQVRQA